MPGPLLHRDRVAGQYRTDAGTWHVTLARKGEGLELLALAALPEAIPAFTDDCVTLASLFSAPLPAVDRYPDWADFEWQTRGPQADARFGRVWRIAQTSDRAAFLGFAVQPAEASGCIPLAAALWRGWGRVSTAQPRALFWSSGRLGHLWVMRPFALPSYACLGPNPSPDDIICAVAQRDHPRHVILETGGIDAACWRVLESTYPGAVRQAEPFAELIVPAPLRQQIVALPDATVYLPAVGAARALADGAPAVQRTCESSPEVAVDGG